MFEALLSKISTLESIPVAADSPQMLEQTVGRYNQYVAWRLNAILLSPETDESKLNALEGYLAENWLIIKHTALSYTAMPASEATDVLCYAAALIAEKKADKNILGVLMPTVHTASNTADFPNLEPQNIEEIITILKSHVLFGDAKYLVPVKVLSKIEPDTPLSRPNNASLTQIINPYCDTSDTSLLDEDYYISHETLHRLVNHSSEARAIWSTYQHYIICANDQSNLLGHLKQLTCHLYINSAYGGTGTGVNAGGGAYGAIIDFNDYYQTLSEGEKEHIPAQVKEAIDLLIRLSSDPKQNHNGNGENIETCIANRRAQLETVIHENVSALSNIAVTEKRKRHLVMNAYKDFKANCVALHKAFAIDGKDILPLTRELMDNFGVEVQVNSLEAVNLFLRLSPGEIQDFLQNNAPLQQQIINTIGTLETLVIMATETGLEQLSAFFKSMTDAFVANQKVKTPRDLSALLIALAPERVKLICQAMQCRLPEIIKSGYDLGVALQHLAPDQCRAVIKALQDKLPEIIKPGIQFLDALQHLSPDQCRAVIEAMKDKLPKIIKSVWALGSTLQHLSPDQCRAVIKALQDKLPETIKSGDDLGVALQHLAPDQCQLLIDALKDQLPKIIKSGKDLGDALVYLTPDPCRILIDAMKDKLREIIKSGDDLGNALKYLDPAQRQILIEAMQEKLREIIKSGDDLGNALKYLDPAQRQILIEAMQEKPPEITEPGDGLGYSGNGQNSPANALPIPQQRRTLGERLRFFLPAIFGGPERAETRDDSTNAPG